MVKRRTVLLLIPHLGGGGLERVSALLAWGLSPAKYNVHLGLVTQLRSQHEPLPPWVSVHALGARRVRSAALRLIRLVTLLKPDVILSSAPHLNFLVLLIKPFFPMRTRILVRQSRTASARFRSSRWPDNSRLLYRLLYPRADRVICQTRAMAADLSSHAGVQLDRTDVLPNPVDTESFSRGETFTADRWHGPGPHLLAVGRLSHEKGFDLLLEAFASLRLRYPGADLCVLGTGPEQQSLLALTDSLGIADRVHFTGYVSRPEAWFGGATLFVLPSRSEGLPNALLEAAAAGLPICSTPCSDGVVELIAGEAGSWLAKDCSASALRSSIVNALGRITPGERFRHAWIDTFQIGRAVSRYEEIIDRLPQRQPL